MLQSLALSLVSTFVNIATFGSIKAIRAYSNECYSYIRIYGFVGLYLALFSSPDVWRLVRDVLQSDDDDATLSFREAQVHSVNMIAVTVRMDKGNFAAKTY